MPLPTAADVVNEYLYGESQTPENFNSDQFTNSSVDRTVNIDTAAFFDPVTGPGRFALARNSPLVQTFFGENVLDIVHLINGYDPTWVEPDGSYRLTKQQMAELYGVEYYGITVSNRKVTDGYDDYAERTFIWGGTKFKLSDDVRFVIDAQGNRYIDNMAIVRDGDDNFNFEGTDIITNVGNIALEHAIDPSGVGSAVDLIFDEYDPDGYVYTI